MRESLAKQIWVRAAALVLGLGLLAIIWQFARFFGILLLGITVAAALAPLAHRLARHLPWGLAVILIYLILTLALIGIGWAIVPPLVGQATNMVQNIPAQVNQLDDLLNGAGIDMRQFSLVDLISSGVSQLGTILLALPMRLLSVILDFVLLIFISLYTLIEAPRLARFLRSLFPEERGRRILAILEHISEAMGGYFRGSLINGVIIGAVTFLGMLIIGVQYPIVLGLLAGLLELIPIIGPIVAGSTAVVVTVLQAPGKVLIVLAFFVILQQLENQILTPYVMRSQTHVSPLLILLALFVGSVAGGLLGALVAIPLAAAFNVLVIEVIAPAIRRWSGKEDQPEDLPVP